MRLELKGRFTYKLFEFSFEFLNHKLNKNLYLLRVFEIVDILIKEFNLVRYQWEQA